MIDMRIMDCGCMPCAYAIRSIGAELDPGGDFTNMVNWVNAYDITTVPWGTTRTGYFISPSATTPDGTPADIPSEGGAGYPTNLTQCVTFNEDYTACVGNQPCPLPIVYRSQFYIPFPTAYYVLAYGTSISASGYADCGAGGTWISAGCIYPQQAADQYPMIVDLPIPDSTYWDSEDPTIQVQYYWLGIIDPGATLPGAGVFAVNMTPIPNLTSLTPDNAGVTGFGSGWNPNQVCYGNVNDPFNDSDPP
jgi:hypothetical protein